MISNHLCLKVDSGETEGLKKGDLAPLQLPLVEESTSVLYFVFLCHFQTDLTFFLCRPRQGVPPPWERSWVEEKLSSASTSSSFATLPDSPDVSTLPLWKPLCKRLPYTALPSQLFWLTLTKSESEMSMLVYISVVFAEG